MEGPTKIYEQEVNEQETPQDVRILRQLGAFAAKEIASNAKVLAMIEQGNLTQDQFRAFAVQRYLAAAPFERLLHAGIEGAKKNNDVAIIQALTANLHDERGILSDGNQDPELAHETWRKDFFAALGIDHQTLAEAHSLPGTRRYIQKIDELIAEGNTVKITAALYALERSIPHEFRRILRGAEKIFPNEFTSEDPAQMLVQTRAKIERSRRYLEDHIRHDAQQHAPDLEKALACYVSSRTTFRDMNKGLNDMIDAKRYFYRGIEDAFHASP